jgi:hypothetical protein
VVIAVYRLSSDGNFWLKNRRAASSISGLFPEVVPMEVDRPEVALEADPEPMPAPRRR